MVVVLCSLVGAGCMAHAPTREPVPSMAEVQVVVEQRKFVVRVVSYDMGCAVFDAVPPEHTVHLDCLEFDILAPHDWAGKRWHLFIFNQVWSAPVDYGFRPGDELAIDVAPFGQTKAELDAMITSTEGMNSVWIPPELIRKIASVRADPANAAADDAFPASDP